MIQDSSMPRRRGIRRTLFPPLSVINSAAPTNQTQSPRQQSRPQRELPEWPKLGRKSRPRNGFGGDSPASELTISNHDDGIDNDDLSTVICEAEGSDASKMRRVEREAKHLLHLSNEFCKFTTALTKQVADLRKENKRLTEQLAVERRKNQRRGKGRERKPVVKRELTSRVPSFEDRLKRLAKADSEELSPPTSTPDSPKDRQQEKQVLPELEIRRYPFRQRLEFLRYRRERMQSAVDAVDAVPRRIDVAPKKDRRDLLSELLLNRKSDSYLQQKDEESITEIALLKAEVDRLNRALDIANAGQSLWRKRAEKLEEELSYERSKKALQRREETSSSDSNTQAKVPETTIWPLYDLESSEIDTSSTDIELTQSQLQSSESKLTRSENLEENTRKHRKYSSFPFPIRRPSDLAPSSTESGESGESSSKNIKRATAA